MTAVMLQLLKSKLINHHHENMQQVESYYFQRIQQLIILKNQMKLKITEEYYKQLDHIDHLIFTKQQIQLTNQCLSRCDQALCRQIPTISPSRASCNPSVTFNTAHVHHSSNVIDPISKPVTTQNKTNKKGGKTQKSHRKTNQVMLTKIGYPKIGIKWCVRDQSVRFIFFPKHKSSKHKTHQTDTTSCADLKLSAQMKLVYDEIEYLPCFIDYNEVLELTGRPMTHPASVKIKEFILKYNELMNKPLFSSYKTKLPDGESKGRDRKQNSNALYEPSLKKRKLSGHLTDHSNRSLDYVK
eukprot:46831_1